VVSIGGLTVGGSGKTPMAACVARGLAGRGFRVVLASRGYLGANREPVLAVSDGARILASVAAAGDEPLLLAAHASGVPVLVGRDRRVVGHHAVSIFGAEILVLDDGFQHHRIARDLDLVCLDGLSGVGNGHVLPWGPLREPLSSLRQADWICVVDPVDPGGRGLDTQRDVSARVVADFAASGRRVLRAHRRPRQLRALERETRAPLADLSGREVGLIAGVARPLSVRRTLEALGARVVAERLFPDHHAYRPEDLADLDPSVSEWITTEKDALKILPAWLAGRSLSVLEIELEIEDEAAVFDEIERLLRVRRPAAFERDRDPASV
jgi:tetraacyldisaccharide 4'-kinase